MRPLLPFLLLAPAAAAQDTLPVTGLPVRDPVAEAIIHEADAHGQVMEILDELVNGIGPRLTSSRNLTEACEWAAAKFEGWGLENVRLEEWGTFPVGFDRGLQRGRVVEPFKRRLEFGTAAWSAGTDGPLRGPVVRAPRDDAELDALRSTLAGAWVLLDRARPRWDRDEDTFGARLGRFLDEEGIAGTLRPARGDLIVTGGRWRVDPDDLPRRVEIQLARTDAEWLATLLEEGRGTEAEFEIQNRFVRGPVPVYDVVAEIPGTELPGELVIFGGHVDSWDGAEGAQDNGTGVATTLEAARILAKLGVKPRRTIRFMLWSGEEQGLLGSQGYIDRHEEENERISAVIVHDGGTNALVGLLATPAMAPVLEEAFLPVFEMVAAADQGGEDPIGFTITERDGLPRGVGSDHDAYLAAGVPGFFWMQSGEASYSFIHHTQHDHYSEVVPRYQRHNAKVVALAAWRLANTRQMLPREGLAGPPPRRLGIFLDDDGRTVSEVIPSGLAARAGIRARDQVVEMDGRTLDGPGDLRRRIRSGGDRKVIVVLRDGARRAFWVDWGADESGALEEAPAPAGAR